MSITESSVFLQFFLAFWLGLKNAVSHSGVNALCHKLERGVRRLLSGSVLWHFVWREGVVSRAWKGWLFTGFFNILCAIVKAL